MKPTQKQPEPLKNVAATRREVENFKKSATLPWGLQAVEVMDRLLTERDEAIREVARLKNELETKGEMFLVGQIAKLREEVESLEAALEKSRIELVEAKKRLHDLPHNDCPDCGLEKELAEEKRRTAACLKVIDNLVRFRTGDYVGWSKAGGPNECKHGFAAGLPCPDCTMTEAQKILAPSDSGGEKEKSL